MKPTGLGEASDALGRKSPVVCGVGMIEPHLRHRPEEISARSNNAVELLHRAPWVYAVLNHLGADDEVEESSVSPVASTVPT